MKNKKNKLSSFIYILSILLLSCLPTRGQNLGTGMQNLVDWKFSLDSTHWKQVSIPHFYNAIDGHSRKYFSLLSSQCGLDRVRPPSFAVVAL